MALVYGWRSYPHRHPHRQLPAKCRGPFVRISKAVVHFGGQLTQGGAGRLRINCWSRVGWSTCDLHQDCGRRSAPSQEMWRVNWNLERRRVERRPLWLGTLLEILLLQPGDPDVFVGNRHVPRPQRNSSVTSTGFSEACFSRISGWSRGTDQLSISPIRAAPVKGQNRCIHAERRDPFCCSFKDPQRRCAVSVALIDVIDATHLISSVQIPIAHRRCCLHQHVPAVSSLGACPTPALQPRRHGPLSHEGQESDNPLADTSLVEHPSEKRTDSTELASVRRSQGSLAQATVKQEGFS
jgi:hypothetical protein